MPPFSHQQIEAFAQDRPNDKALRLWWRHIVKHPWLYILGLSSIIAVDLSDVSIPKVMKQLVDTLSQNNHVEKKLPWIILAFLLLQAIARIVWRITWAQQTHVVSAAMKSRLWERATYFPWPRLHEDLTPGELMNIAAGDVNNARTIFGFSLVTIADIIFLTLFGSVTLFLLHPQMALSSFTIYIFILPILKKISTKQGAAYLRAQHKLSVVSETLAQYLRNIRQEKLFSSSSYWQNLLKKDTLAYQKEREQALHWEITYVPVSGLAPWIAYVSFLSWGLYSYWQNQITLGTFVAFQSLLFIMQDPLLEIGTCLSETQRAWTSLKRYLHTINTEPDPIYALENSAFKTNQNISQTEESLFSVRNVLLPTPTTINLEIKNGEKIGIQGGVGTGKTRLLNFIAGLDRQYQGEIYFLHTEIRQIPHSFLRKHIQLVPQKPFLFSQTLMENLSMGQDVSLENIFQVLNICCLDEDFKNWETQLNVPLLEWGQNLSGGQRQRLTLARALLQKAEVYLFDDCMSAVDPTTELKILKRIESYISSSTVLWTAHRLSTLKLCNRVINWSASTHEISK